LFVGSWIRETGRRRPEKDKDKDKDKEKAVKKEGGPEEVGNGLPKEQEKLIAKSLQDWIGLVGTRMSALHCRDGSHWCAS
jgi:hypothetical protein